MAEALDLRFINFTFRSLAEERGLTLEEVLSLAAQDDSWDKELDMRQVALAQAGGGCVLAIWMLKDADLTVYLKASSDTSKIGSAISASTTLITTTTPLLVLSLIPTPLNQRGLWNSSLKKPALNIAGFYAVVYDNYAAGERLFPWWENVDPWGVLVSEFMLQQTQAKRVIPYWERWMWLWSTSADLNKATLEEALRKWSGLGYNRCCRFLKDCARVITEERRRGARHFRSLVTVVGHWCIPCGRYCLFCL